MNASSNNIDKKRMTKNTVVLYIRMLFALLLGFYTVRLLIASLGIEDYGLYNVIFGLVTAFSFFSGAMQSTVQRFLCCELGKDNEENIRRVFSASLVLFIVLSALVVLFAETIGLWFLKNKLNIPCCKMNLALNVYQFSIFMIIFKVLQIPYIAVITSYENMQTYAKISILDVCLHFASVAVLLLISENRLIFFVGFYTLSNFIILLFYVLYCWKKYSICRIGLHCDKKYLKEMSSFFSWSLFGALANISRQQGLNLLLNVFCGVILNATWGIATQVGGAITQFYISFQQAFNPQILKSVHDPDRKAFFDLLQSCSKYSFFLVWLVALPLLLQTEFLLKLWLGNNLPDSVVIFTQFMVICVIIDAISAPLWVAVQATGNILRYQIELSILLCSTCLFSLICLQMGVPAYFVALVNTVINFLAWLYRLIYLCRVANFPVISYFFNAIIPITIVGGKSAVCGILTQVFVSGKWNTIILYLVLISLINLIITVLFGLSASERLQLSMYIKRKLKA